MSNDKSGNKDVIICDCHSTEHQMVFIYSDDDNIPLVYVHTHLNKKPFWERLKYGIKYIFGYKCRYGCFDCYILRPEDTNRFRDLLDRYTEAHNTWIKELNERSKGSMDKLIQDSEDMGVYK